MALPLALPGTTGERARARRARGLEPRRGRHAHAAHAGRSAHGPLHAFPWLALDLAAFFPTLEHAGTRVDAGRTLERLRLTDALGQPATAELDLANDRLVSLELLDTRTDPPSPVRIDFETWRELDGLLLPERVVAHDAHGDWTLELERAELTSEP